MDKQLKQKILIEQRGSALAFTLLVTAVLMVLAVAIISVTGTDSQIVLAREESKTAQYMAESAVEVAKQKLLQELTMDPQAQIFLQVDETMDIGGVTWHYKCDVLRVNDNEFQLWAWGYKGDFKKPQVVKKLDVVLQSEAGNGLPAGDNPPVTPPTTGAPTEGVQPQLTDTTALDQALMGGGNLQLTNDNKVEQGPQTKGLPAQLIVEGSVFSNSSIRLADGIVTGVQTSNGVTEAPMVRAVGAIDLDDAAENKYNGVRIMPNQTLRLPMPVVNMVYLAHYKSDLKDKVVTSTSRAFVSGPVLNNRDIVFVDGDIHLTGEVAANALIVATRNIIIYDDFKFPDASNASIGLFAGNNITVMSRDNQVPEGIQGPKIRGLLIAGNDIKTEGEGIIEGSVIAGNQFQSGNGTFIIKHFPENVSRLFDVWGPQIIENYDSLNVSYPISAPVFPTEWTTTPTTGSPALPVPVALKVVRWVELN